MIERVPQTFDRLLKLLPEGASILDYGCGDASTVATLTSLGYDAWGAETAPNGHRRVSPVTDGRTHFPDRRFDMVYTHAVLEHVDDIDTVAAEIARVTKPAGVGIHEWPGKWRPVEPHIAMPFVHWLPKTPVRRKLIRMWLAAGLYPPAAKPDVPHPELAENEYLYMNEQVFYRSCRRIRSAFERHGFACRWVRHSRCPPGFGPVFRAARTVTMATVKMS